MAVCLLGMTMGTTHGGIATSGNDGHTNLVAHTVDTRANADLIVTGAHAGRRACNYI